MLGSRRRACTQCSRQQVSATLPHPCRGAACDDSRGAWIMEAMARSRPIPAQLARRLSWHQALHDRQREPRNDSRWLSPLRQWQAWRVERSFGHFLKDPQRRDAAMFFLSEVYGDHDFSRRDASVARIVPMMQKLLPASVLATLADAIELDALTHALDLRMAQALESLAPRRKTLDIELYALAYRQVGHRRLRQRQVDLIVRVGQGLAQAVRLPGVAMLLRLSRGPARATGLADLQGFLERGFAAFALLGDATAFCRKSIATNAPVRGGCLPASPIRSVGISRASPPAGARPARPRSGEALAEHAPDLRFDRALHRRHQQSQLGGDVQHARLHGDAAIHAGAVEGQGVAFPSMAHAESAGQLAGHLFKGLAALGGGLAVGMLDFDAGHGAGA